MMEKKNSETKKKNFRQKTAKKTQTQNKKQRGGFFRKICGMSWPNGEGLNITKLEWDPNENNWSGKDRGDCPEPFAPVSSFSRTRWAQQDPESKEWKINNRPIPPPNHVRLKQEIGRAHV